jgi:DNA recombination protein RmuC
MKQGVNCCLVGAAIGRPVVLSASRAVNDRHNIGETMNEILQVAIIVAVVVLLALVLALLVAVSGLRKKLGDTTADNAAARSTELEMTARLLRENREEQANSLARFEETMGRNFNDNRDSIDKRLTENRETIDKRLLENRETLDKRMAVLQESNEVKLEQMRITVDEKLQETVEKRFSESFKMISERLEQVHKGLGEMQQLASGVDDLKKVLSGVKTRGNLGEYQLEAILEQALSPEQYIKNAQVKLRSQERVEFAVLIPSKDDTADDLMLPIDSKFPIEDYERLLDAYDGKGDESFKVVSDRLILRVKSFARDIRDKYINPPKTTDFAIMFVPTEGLYAEILRQPGLFELLQREYRVTVVGPTNLVAFLSSLQMGFRTLAIEKRSSEVWQLLGAIKNQFGQFDKLLEGVKKKLDAASNEMDKVSSKTRNITKKLGKVQELPATESLNLLEAGDD